LLGTRGEILAHRDAYLSLERLAVEPYVQFVYDNAAQADMIRERLFSDVACEFSADNGRLLLIEGRPAAMICCMPAPVVSRGRLRAAMYLVRSGLLEGFDDVRQRMELASSTLMKLAPSDYYLSRIAVDSSFNGSGAADELVRYCEHEALRSGATRICLEVARENKRAIRLYARHGFHEVEVRTVHAAQERSLSYLHMVKSLPRHSGAE
jgi:ribosomal protein S18 acetylase RimI-like enzyme